MLVAGSHFFLPSLAILILCGWPGGLLLAPSDATAFFLSPASRLRVPGGRVREAPTSSWHRRSMLKSTTTTTNLPTNSSSSGGGAVMSATNSSTTSNKTTGTPAFRLPPGTTFYRRELKPPCVAFSSEDGRQLFREALAAGNMEGYFRLAEQFRTQEEVTFCGLSTLTMVLNALAVDPGRVWKGPWRWYHESMLDCCAPLETVKDQGITLSTLACLARCNGLAVDVARTDTHTLEDLRAVIEECSSADTGRVVVVTYDRRGLKQTGSGHFSPVGGYHKEKDLVLIMDTARFKLPPHWAPLPILWEAMQRVDPDTGRPRGYMVLEKAHSLSHRLFYANARNYKDWPKVASWVNEMIELACGEPEEENGDLSGLAAGDDGNASKCPAAAAAAAAAAATAADLRESRRALRGATTVAEFVPALMALLPREVKGLLTTFDTPEHGSSSLDVEDLLSTTTPAPPFNATEYASGKAQDVLVLQAIQGTDIYREVTNVERYSRSSDKLKLQQDENQAVAAAAPSSPCCAPNLPSPAAPPLPTSPPAVLSPASGALSSAYSFCPKKSGCGCSWRHEVSIVAYALLLLLHKRDDHGEVCGGGGGGGGGGVSGAGPGGDNRPPPLWRKDPLHQLPATVAIQAKHVAAMLVGLVELEECEKCKAR